MTDEEHRHQCEVRQVLRWRTNSKDTAMKFLAKVADMRGKDVAAKLEQDCRSQWNKGNRGEKGDWR